MSLDDASQRYRSAYAAALAPHRVTVAEADTLLTVDYFKGRVGPSLSEVANRMGADVLPSRTLKQLRKKGLVKRDEDKNDERVRRFRLTAKGKRLATDIRSIRRTMSKKLADQTNKADLIVAQQICAAMDW